MVYSIKTLHNTLMCLVGMLQNVKKFKWCIYYCKALHLRKERFQNLWWCFKMSILLALKSKGTWKVKNVIGNQQGVLCSRWLIGLKILKTKQAVSTSRRVLPPLILENIYAWLLTMKNKVRELHTFLFNSYSLSIPVCMGPKCSLLYESI